MARPLTRKINEVRSAVATARFHLEVASEKLEMLLGYGYVDEKRDARLRRKAGFKKKSKK